MTTSLRAMLHLVALLALLAVQPTQADATNIADLEKKIDQIREQLNKRPSTSAQAGKFISGVTKSVDGAASQIKACVEAGSSCNRGKLAGSLVTLTGSIMTAASFLEPIGPFLGLLGGLLGSIFGGGGASGPPPLTIQEINQAVFAQLQKFALIHYAEQVFPSISKGEMYPWMHTLSVAASMNATELGAKIVEERLKGLQQLLPTLSSEMTGVVTTMDSGYLLATTSRKTGSREVLLGTAPFKSSCASTCSLAKINGIMFYMFGGTLFNKICWTPMRAQVSAWEEFEAMLLGYKTLASQLASVDVLLDGIVLVANETLGSQSTFLEETLFVRGQIKSTVKVAQSRNKMLMSMDYASSCSTPFNMTEPAACTQVSHHKKVAPMTVTQSEFGKLCTPAACVSSECRKVLSSADW